MPLYMSQVSCTSEAWAAMTQNPEDRSEVFGRLTEAMGGRLLSWYYSFGEYDVVVTYEVPEESTALPSSWLPPRPVISVGSRPPCC